MYVIMAADVSFAILFFFILLSYFCSLSELVGLVGLLEMISKKAFQFFD
jgi:hypothetical protein